MITDVYDLAPTDGEEFVVQWLKGIGAASVERPSGATLPYRMVTVISDIRDPFMGSCEVIVSVHTFAATRTAASDAALLTDKRMNLLAVDQADVELANGTIANAEYVKTWQAPTYSEYQPNIKRYIARYQIGLEFT